MNIFLLVLQAIPALLELIRVAESLYPGSGQGPVKKDAVMHGVQSALGVAVAAGAPISNEEAQAITSGVADAVDGVVSLFNRAGWPKGIEGPDK